MTISQSAFQGKVANEARPSPVQDATLNQQPLDSFLLFALRKTQAAILQDFSNRFDALNIRPIQLGALLLIRSNPGSRQSDIAEALGIQRPNFVTMMDELDGRGLTRRTTSTTDRRSYSLALTQQGEALVQQALTLLAEHENTISATLKPTEREQLVANLNRISVVLAKQTTDTPSE